jgi:hypothetical protein
MAHEQKSLSARCRCGETQIELSGNPIESAICYCESCRTAGRRFERDLSAPQTVNSDGSVEYCLYRKDRVTIVQGARNLREYRLKPGSPTRRVVARCCGSPMFTDYTPGHWLSIFRARLPSPAPEPRMRIMTKDKLDGVELSNAIPAHDTLSPRLMIKLLAAWAAMGFRRPKVSW